jgi:AraC family transcriptional regulator
MDAIGPLGWRKLIPLTPAVTSDGLGWAGLDAARFRASPGAELYHPALTHHMLVLFTAPPKELELRYEGVTRRVPPPPGSISLIPAGSSVRVRVSEARDQLHLFLSPEVLARVAANEFDLDPARVSVGPLDCVDLPHLRATMRAVDAEMTAGAGGGRLAAESLANILAVQLIRQIRAPRPTRRPRDGALEPGTLRAVVEHIEDRLDDGLTLARMAEAAHLSAYHFARRFKAATGLAPHHYVISRRIERARELLEREPELSLVEIAARIGFSDQSQFSHHFKRVVGVTPGRFRRSARIP